MRLRILFLSAVLLWTGALPAVPASAPPPAKGRSTLIFHEDATDPFFGSVDLVPASGEALNLLQQRISLEDSHRSFRILVDSGEEPEADTLSVLGQYEVLADRIRFTPMFPPQPGLRYRAVAGFPALSKDAMPASLVFGLPQDLSGPPAAVTRIYPTADVLPANLLKFYIWFSRPMQDGFARDHISLVGPDGAIDAAALFPSVTELWNPSMDRLTLLLDPGRIKRGVGPNRALGPALEAGQTYRLNIAAGMIDARGEALPHGFSKRFKIVPPARAPLDLSRWHIGIPTAGTREPVIVSSPVILDSALFAGMVSIVGPDTLPVAGTFRIDRFETRGLFTPSTPWEAGSYFLQIDPRLEDVAGNTARGSFDSLVDGSKTPVEAARATRIPLMIPRH